ncbi:MAG: aminotransferase class V-fold PLP-dependent enzyme [Planctomycetaceae bacterium]|nr:aminotransferase class V-fold PLP-dependent enzyme [Planctomycetaceae bacterium]
MSSPRRIYLDNAATSWPKPESVYQAVEHFQRTIGAPAGRGAYAEAIQVARQLDRTRQAALELVNGRRDDSVLFTPSCTAALNLAIHGLLRPGDHVVTTVVEHNSVLRPLRFAAEQRGVEVTLVDCDERGFVEPAAVRRALRPATRLVAVAHASNVTGCVQPVEAIGDILSAHPARFLIDAAQTLGHWPCDLAASRADFVAGAGHKGLLAPLGVGLLFARAEALRELTPLVQGGTGSHSESDRQPDDLPDRFESGNLDVPAIWGLSAGLEFLRQRGIADLAQQAAHLTVQLVEGLRAIPRVRVLGPSADEPRVGVVSFQIEGYDPQEVAAGLDAAHRIQLRAGLHCAGRMHERLGTLAAGGALRASFGPFNQPNDVDALLAAIAEFAAAESFP